MASAAEQLAANFNFGNLGKAKELRDRILFTLAMLIIARLGTYIPLPGIDPREMALLISQQQGGLLDMFNMLSGGAVQRMAIFALGIMPYISASIIIQLMTTVFPELEALKKEGEVGRKTHQSVHALRHGRARMHPGLRHRHRSGDDAATHRSSIPAGSFASPRSSR